MTEQNEMPKVRVCVRRPIGEQEGLDHFVPDGDRLAQLRWIRNTKEKEIEHVVFLIKHAEDFDKNLLIEGLKEIHERLDNNLEQIDKELEG